MRTNAVKQTIPRFPLGRRVMTQGVRAALETSAAFQFEVALAMERHAAGDWSEMSADDQAANLAAITEGTRIFSGYESSEGRLFVITEADRSVTTILFAHEY